MTTATDVLSMLCPAGGWIIYNDDFDTIIWVDDRPRCTKKQFTDGFAQYDAWKAEQDVAKVAAKQSAQAKLTALGLTVEDLQALGL
jgi:hypothetical protein